MRTRRSTSTTTRRPRTTGLTRRPQSLHTLARRQGAQHEEWLKALTMLPTAAGREGAVIEWVRSWARTRGIPIRRDTAGNLILAGGGAASSSRRRAHPAPIWITAHLDHPAFVVTRVGSGGRVQLEFRGGVQAPYFEGAAIEIVDGHGHWHPAQIVGVQHRAKPFRRVRALLGRSAGSVRPGDLGRWRFDEAAALPAVRDGRLHTHACDDLAGVAAALSVLDVLQRRRGTEHVSVLLTRAEEIGFVGAIAASRLRTMPSTARLICLENSRSFPDSPVGAGPIVRVGDRASVFTAALTNRIGEIAAAYERRVPRFRWQRKLMSGGTCEATAFSAFGYQATCLCLPLGNYHNMMDLDAVAAGRAARARVGPEFISISDYHGMIELLIVCVTELDRERQSPTARFDGLYREHQGVLDAN